MIKSTTALVRHLRDAGVLGSITRIDATAIMSGCGADRPLIFKVLADNGITYRLDGSYIRVTFPSKARA